MVSDTAGDAWLAWLYCLKWIDRYAAFGIDCEWASGDQLCLVQLSPALPVSSTGNISYEAPLLLDVMTTPGGTTLQHTILSLILKSTAHIKVFHSGKQVG